MAMTKREWLAKQEIQNILGKEGYPTYAYLLQDFDIHLTKDPEVIGYMVPDKGEITLNEDLDLSQVSVIVRHEILHEFFNHAHRFEQHVGADKYKNRSSATHQNMNIAGDYDISNRGYTTKDKENIRQIKLNDQILSGLVTEDEHPDWVDLSAEEMFDKLNQADQEYEQQMQQVAADLQNSQDQDSDPRNDQQQKQGGSGKSSSKKPQIGDTGNADIQAAEEAARQADDYKKEAQKQANQAGKAGNKGTEEAAKGLASQASDLGKEADELADSAKDGNGLSQEEKDRLERVKQALNDIKNQQAAIQETEDAVFTDKQLQYQKQKSREMPTNKAARIVDSVVTFMRNETAYLRSPSWKRPSKKSTPGSNIISKGRARDYNTKVPLINVYFDHSASWDESKIKEGQDVVNALNRFERQGKIKIKTYYFGNHVTSDPHDYNALGGGTGATQEILDHIKATKADNVIIMTDSDMDYQGRWNRPITVDGGVWLIFKGGICQKVIDYLKGKKLTKKFIL